jgi:hypothetical protein
MRFLPTTQMRTHIIHFIDADGTETGSLVLHHGGGQAPADFEDPTGPGGAGRESIDANEDDGQADSQA